MHARMGYTLTARAHTERSLLPRPADDDAQTNAEASFFAIPPLLCFFYFGRLVDGFLE